MNKLSRTVYSYQLHEVSFNTLNVDYEVSGVGRTVIRQLEKYRVKQQVKTLPYKDLPFLLKWDL